MPTIEDRIAQAEARLNRSRQRGAAAQLELNRLGKRLTGEARARDTRRKVLVGVACISLLSDARLSLDLRNKIRASLRSRLTDADNAVVADLLAPEVAQ